MKGSSDSCADVLPELESSACFSWIPGGGTAKSGTFSFGRGSC